MKPESFIMAFIPVVRQSSRPKEATEALQRMGVQDVSLENRLEVRASGDEHEIILIGAVGKSWWDDSGITEQEVRDALKSIPKGKPITITVNSEGGSVKEGLGIYNAIKDRNSDIKVRIAGYALSIASVFPLAAKKSLGGRGVVSPDAAIWMEHQAWTWASGNADDMRQTADMLETHDETLIDIYAAASGQSKEYHRTRMQKETWTKGSAAVDAGLADEAETEDKTQASYRALHPDYLARCKNLSGEILNALSAAPKQGAAKPQTQQKANTMEKKLIVALLVKHGIEAKDTETEDELQAKLDKVLTAKLQKDSSAENLNDIAAMRKELAGIKNQRIEDKINAYVDQNRCTKAEAKIFLASAITSAEAEKEVFAALEERQAADVGGASAGIFIEGSDSVPALPTNKNGVQGSKVIAELDNIFASHKDNESRYNAMKAEFPRLLRAASRRDGGVQAANTFSATVTTNFLIAGAIQKLSGRFAAANLFARDAEQDPYKPLAVGIRKFNSTATDGSQVQTNPTDFEGLGAGGESTIDPITITPALLVSGGHLTHGQLQSGFRVADIIEKKLIDLAAKVTQTLTAPITVANFVTNTPQTSAPAAFSFSDLAALQGILKKTSVKNLILDGEYISRIANTPGFFQAAGTVGGAANGATAAWRAFGWDNIALNTDWSAAGANVRGFACGQDAIGFISGLPIAPPEGIPGNIVQMGVVNLPDVNISIATYAWYNSGTRTFQFTFDVILGASLVDELQGVLIKSA